MQYDIYSFPSVYLLQFFLKLFFASLLLFYFFFILFTCVFTFLPLVSLIFLQVHLLSFLHLLICMRFCIHASINAQWVQHVIPTPIHTSVLMLIHSTAEPFSRTGRDGFIETLDIVVPTSS